MSGAADPVAEAARSLDAARSIPAAPDAPLVPGAVGLHAVDGRVTAVHVTGDAVAYDAAGRLLDPADREPMRADTVFDVASLTKLFTATVAMQQVEAGRLELDAPVTRYLPEFAAGGKDAIAVHQLLTHTSGLKWWLPLWRDWPGPQERFAAAVSHPAAAGVGTAFVYSDLNLITLGLVLECVGGQRLDVLVREGITEPLGLTDTGFAPQLEHVAAERFAATEIEDDAGRGLVRGAVHDENAWSLGEVAGHAGVFSTAHDLLRFVDVFVAGGGAILRQESVTAMTRNLNDAMPDDAHGLGFEIDQPRYMGELSGPRTIGHTGFTGTSVVADLDRRAVAVLLTNAVHPHRPRTSINVLRAAWASSLARSLHRADPA